MFGTIISPVQFSTCPVVLKLALGLSASEPVEAAVHCLEFSRNDSIIHHTCSGGVVCLEGGFGCGHFISYKVCSIATISCAVINIAPNSTSEAEDMIASVSTGPFHQGIASFS